MADEKLIAEDGPAFVVGPVFDCSTPDGVDRLRRWLFEQHVSVCAKGGVGCATCVRAGEMGISRPA